jgi:hypothetical protein
LNLPDLPVLSAHVKVLSEFTKLTYPVPLTVKKRSRLLNHLLIRLFLANAGGEV